METSKLLMIKFGNDEVILELVEETNGICKYQTTKYNYDLDADEKSTLTFTLELSPMTDQEKKKTVLYNMFYGKTPKQPTIPGHS